MKFIFRKTLQTALCSSAIVVSQFMVHLSHADIMVISHANVTTKNLSKDDIRLIFLNKSDKLSNKKSSDLVLLELDSKAARVFFKQVMRMTPSKFKAHWATQIFTGKGQSPIYIDNPQEIIDYVASTPYAVGLVDVGKNNIGQETQQIFLDGVRTLYTLKN